MRNPDLIELTRGTLVESVHAGGIAVAQTDGRIVASAGDIDKPIFPRSAIKPLQAIPLVASGAADRYGFGAAEIAIACGSHSGTPRHVALVESMLARAGLTAAALGCGAHEPMHGQSANELIRAGTKPTALHHNCSGKHAGMLVTAAHLGEPVEGYWRPDHPVQARIRAVLEAATGHPLGADMCGIDGCSVPNWAIPLGKLAAAFARLPTGEGLTADQAQISRRIADACRAEPGFVAGPGRLDTIMMTEFGTRVLMKNGAEGVYCGALPVRGLGFALKIDDGTKRAAEAAVAALIARIYPEAKGIGPDARLHNWRGLDVGEVRPAAALLTLLDAIG